MADVEMPQLGETVTEGTVTRWFKQVGDTVAEDEPLFEVSTDKVDSEVPSPVSGTVTEILVAEGQTVGVGAVLARVGAAVPAGSGEPEPSPPVRVGEFSAPDAESTFAARSLDGDEREARPMSDAAPAAATAADGAAERFDVVVVGGGPGGYATALYGAAAGLHIALIEKGRIGGTCLNVGCIPAKELLETAHVYRTVRKAAEFGVLTDHPTIDWSATLERKQAIIDKLVGGLGQLLKSREVTVFDGYGRLHANHRVTVSGGASGEVELVGDRVVLAPGSVARTIPGFEVDGTLVMTSDEFLSMPDLPARAAVIGGGAIGCEFASTMADLGTEVTVLEALPKILPGCDQDITRVVEQSFKKRNISVRAGVSVTGHTPRDGGGTSVSLGDGESVEVDVVVVSVGRKPNTDDLGLDGTAVSLDERGFIEIDDACRTAERGVYAVGDCNPSPALAHVAFAEGILVVKDILGEEAVPIDYGAVPWCIYCHPEVAFAGHSEESARAAGFDVAVSKHRFAGNGRAMIVGDTEGMVKIIAEVDGTGKAGRILGVHMVGPWVTEQLGQGYLAVNWEATVDEVAQFIQPHPTMSELFGESVLAMTGRGLHG